MEATMHEWDRRYSYKRDRRRQDGLEPVWLVYSYQRGILGQKTSVELMGWFDNERDAKEASEGLNAVREAS